MNPSTSSAPKPAIQHGKIAWPAEPSQPQSFSIPFSIIYYISKNPSNPTVYLKLAQSCKYFFEKLPLLIAKDVYGKSRFCANFAKECCNNGCKCCVDIDLTKLTSKIWLTNKIRVTNINVIPNSFSLLSSKLYRSDAVILCIQNKHVIYDDFKFIASSAKSIILRDVKMVYKDGGDVTLDAILEAVPYVEELHCSPPIMGLSSLKNILSLQNLLNLREFYLYDISEDSKAEDYMEVIQKLKHAKTRLHFVDNISDGFKSQLNALIDTVIKDETMKCVIRYNGQDAEKLKIMIKRF